MIKHQNDSIYKIVVFYLSPTFSDKLFTKLCKLALSAICKTIYVLYGDGMTFVVLTKRDKFTGSKHILNSEHNSYFPDRTISDTPGTVDVYLEEDQGRKFYQCEYGWWDHSIALGNISKYLQKFMNLSPS